MGSLTVRAVFWASACILIATKRPSILPRSCWSGDKSLLFITIHREDIGFAKSAGTMGMTKFLSRPHGRCGLYLSRNSLTEDAVFLSGWRRHSIRLR
jgi:hypothetical protein